MTKSQRSRAAGWLAAVCLAALAGCANGGMNAEDATAPIVPGSSAGIGGGNAGSGAAPITPGPGSSTQPPSTPATTSPSGTGGTTGSTAPGGAGSIAGSGGSGTVTTPAGTGGGGAGGTSAVPPSDPAAPCTGKKGMKGDQVRDWNGVGFIVHYPSNLDANKPVPLVIVAHGFTMDGSSMQVLTGFDGVADKDGFVVVYPNGDGGATPWDVGVGACAPGGLISAGAADSLHGYLDALRASVEVDQCINPKQIFVTGFSMGGYFSHHVGCQRGNELARAVGPHSGGTYAGDCPGAPVPIFIMHGGADSFIDHVLCGQGARDLWIPRNKCSSEFDRKTVSGGNCEWYKGCDPNGQTVYCEFDGVGHAWAGSDATSAVWDFFKMYL